MLDTSRARERFGFTARVGLEEGLRRTIEWYQETYGACRLAYENCAVPAISLRVYGKSLICHERRASIG